MQHDFIVQYSTLYLICIQGMNWKMPKGSAALILFLNSGLDENVDGGLEAPGRGYGGGGDSWGKSHSIIPADLTDLQGGRGG
jgi:hypothetical protein